ncbi:MAG: 2Fe-2S iron-sulfur cluster binding domain-containing protein [Rhodopseudomonas sp.]|nr:2Fe-2S iron-sulfur cluster binding domain-containing protein [Rhodopseudomonas sp.]
MTDANHAVMTTPLLVTRKKAVAQDTFLFELKPPQGQELPEFTPGSHITVRTPSGQSRRYSLCNAPQERDRYLIAVKKEPGGRGGSISMAVQLQEGDTIEIEPPANEFKMSNSKPAATIFIAGGIGITPIRSMILDCLHKGDRNFKLFYFTRTADLMAFRDEFLAPDLAENVVLHHDNGDPEQAYDLWPILENQNGAELYCCGPKGLMDAVRDMTGHWSDSSVHFEDFVGATAKRPDDKPFEIILGKSGERLEVAADVSILDTLRNHGHLVPSSCESGTCGTCRTRFTAGEPDHRDFVLSEKEKKTEIMICVSRARSPSLTLDL